MISVKYRKCSELGIFSPLFTPTRQISMKFGRNDWKYILKKLKKFSLTNSKCLNTQIHDMKKIHYHNTGQGYTL